MSQATGYIKEPPPCTCIPAGMTANPALARYRPPILDPFCPGVSAHREGAVLDREPTYGGGRA